MSPEILGAAAIAGIASSPHCAGMCGPLVVAGCAGSSRGLRETIGYHAGRATSYAFVGALAGHASHAVLSTRLGGVLTAASSWIVALFFAVAAIRVLLGSRRAAPNETLVSLRRERPRSVLSAIARFVPRRGLPLGLATGFLPCGSLVGGALLAASTASALEGAFTMLVFALASAPVLVAAALVGNRVTAIARRWPRGALAALLVAAAILAGSRPWWIRQDTSCVAPSHGSARQEQP